MGREERNYLFGMFVSTVARPKGATHPYPLGLISQNNGSNLHANPKWRLMDVLRPAKSYSLLVKKSNVMSEVVDGVMKELSQRHQPRLGMDSRAVPRISRDKTKNASHLATGECHQFDFFGQVALVVMERLRIATALRSDQERALHCQCAFHSIGEKLFAVRDVADDFECAPSARNRRAAKFLGGHAHDGGSEVGNTSFVGRDQIGGTLRHILPLSVGDLIELGHALPRFGCFENLRRLEAGACR